MSYPAPVFHQRVGRVIRDARVAADMSQSALAGIVGVGQSTVAHWELGHSIPRLDTFTDLCEALRLDAGCLTGAAS